MVIDNDGTTVFEGFFSTQVSTEEYDKFLSAVSSSKENVGIVANSKEIAERELARIREDRMKREHRRRR